MKVIDFIMFCYCDLDGCRVRLPPFSARSSLHSTRQREIRNKIRACMESPVRRYSSEIYFDVIGYQSIIFRQAAAHL